jgi:hypothetical protein
MGKHEGKKPLEKDLDIDGMIILKCTLRKQVCRCVLDSSQDKDQ